MSHCADPELLCLHLELPGDVAARLGGGHSGLPARHHVEKKIQDLLWSGRKIIRHHVSGGSGSLDNANIYILTDQAGLTMQALWWLMFFPVGAIGGSDCVDIRSYAALGWRDNEDAVWRTFFPQNTRPFFTYLQPPEIIEGLLEKGRAVKA
jgi:hypothetical protein